MDSVDVGGECAEASRSLLLDLAVEFIDAAEDNDMGQERARELLALRRRAAMRLLPKPKMGYENWWLNSGTPVVE